MNIREREPELRNKFGKSKLNFDESTYHYSSTEKEEEFINLQFKTAGEIKKYRQYREEWHRRIAEMEAGTFPLAVICELVSFCNLKCEMCYTITPAFQNSIVGAQRILPWDTVVKIIDECAEIGVYSILFSWRGESSLYKSRDSSGKYRDFADVLDYARKKGLLEVTSLTNGRLLSDELIEKIVKAQPNWLSFSIDGLEEEYNKIRKSVKAEKGRNPFEIVTDSIKKIIRKRNELSLTRPLIRTNTIYPPIARNPEKYRKLMEDIGVGLITVNEMLDFRSLEIPEDAIMDNWFCSYPFQRLVVSANGVILACPGSHNEEDELVLGKYIGTPKKKIIVNGKTKTLNYPEITLQQAWDSDKIKNIRKLHKENRRKKIWACKHCRHGAKKYGVTCIPEDWNIETQQWEDRRQWRNG